MFSTPKYFNFVSDVLKRWACEQPESPASWWINPETSQEVPGEKEGKIVIRLLPAGYNLGTKVWTWFDARCTRFLSVDYAALAEAKRLRGFGHRSDIQTAFEFHLADESSDEAPAAMS